MLNLLKLINPSSKQRQFLEAFGEKRFVLYGGAMGGGKSYILRWALVWLLMELAKAGLPRAEVGLFCEDYPSLADRQIGKIRFEFPAELGELKLGGDTRDFVLHDQYGGGRIKLRNLDDPSKYQSSEFAAIAVDELTKNDQKMFDFLRTRLRWPGIDYPKFAAGTNPGGKGHGWVKKFWLDQDLPTELKPFADEFIYIHAKAADNPHLSAQYYADLESLPEGLRQPFLEGNWNIFAGQYFTNFDPRTHVVEASEIQLKPWETRWLSMDWGFEHSTVAHWHSINERSETVTYREYRADHTSPRKLAEEIIERNRGEKLGAFYLSPDAFAQRTAEATIAEQLWAVFAEHGLPQPAQASNDRIGGWQLMYQLLESGQWRISNACPKLIECLPTLVRDEKKVEDIAKVKGDDAADSARYGLYSHLRPATMPMQEKLDQRIEAAKITDPTSAMIWRNKWEAQERRKMMPAPFGRKWRRFANRPA